MFKIQSYQTTTVLPNPELHDSEGLLDDLEIKRVLGGNKFYYINTKASRRKFIVSFKLARLKAIELREFIKSYFASEIKIIDHLNRIWIGYFTINPFDFTSINTNITNISLEFEAIIQ